MRLLDKILDLLYPKKCIICRKVLDSAEDHICAECVKSLPYSGRHGASRKIEFVEEVCFPFLYRGKMADAIKRYKFNNLKGYADFFSKTMSRCIAERLGTDFDVITWVPISTKRLKNRGYNQSQLLAEKISISLNIPCRSLLRKTHDNLTQSDLHGDEKRRANVLGVYEIADIDITGLKVLIIDDVVTSGATLSECSRTLLMGGAEIVYGAAIASARKKK